MHGIFVRKETPEDLSVIRAINRAAFGQDAEADLVDTLRRNGAIILSLVAEVNGEVVGHILFSPVTLSPPSPRTIAALAPMAVRPDMQRRGIGSALVQAGIEGCRALGYDALVLLGHPDFYPRFGFLPSVRFGFRSTYDVPDEVFMAMELKEGGLEGVKGTVLYREEFEGV